ncbi:MAG: SdrD B-like domain-containing protein [Caldilineaceae bacterium]
MNRLSPQTFHQPFVRTLRTLLHALMLASLLAGLIPPPLVSSVAPRAVAELVEATLPQPKTALAAGTVSGTVFQDYDSDGVKDSATTADPRTDTGVAGVTVTLYDAAGTPQGSAVTSATGTYSISAGGTGPYRVEFTTLPTGYYPTFHNSTSGSNTTAPSSTATTAGTAVQFVPDGGASNVNLGINYPADYAQSNPLLVTSRYQYGHQTGSQNDPNGFGTVNFSGEPTLLSFPYTAGAVSGANSAFDIPSPTPLSLARNVGTTWGLAYARTTRKLYAAAYFKRHAGFGPGADNTINTGDDPGAIYVIDMETNTVDTVFTVSNVTTNAHSTTNYDTDNGNTAWDAVGKTSLGGAALSEDETILYVMDLQNRTLIAMDATSGTVLNGTGTYGDGAVPLNPPTPDLDASATQTPTAATCAVNDARPFAVTQYRGTLYVGIVCSAQSTQNRNDLIGYVYTVNPSTLNFGASPLFTFPLHYPRGRTIHQSFGTNPAEWNPWASTYTGNETTGFNNAISYPQPMLTGIAFDNDNLVLGLRDRLGDQIGNGTSSNPSDTNGTYLGFSAGDTLRACGNAESGWTLESNGRCGGLGSSTQDTGYGPGSGANSPPGAGTTGYAEYYSGETYIEPTYSGTFHDEISVGGIAQLPGAADVSVTVYDAIDNVTDNFDGGVRWMSNSTGAYARAYRIYNGASFNEGSLGKANGLGDLEILADPAPIEIGNRVWEDTDGDGIQDPDEAPITGVIVELYKSGVKVGQATTNAQGEYYFTSGTNATDANTNDNIIHDSSIGIIPGTGALGGDSAYEIRIPNVTGGSKQAALGANELTAADAGNNDSIDSDGALSGVNAVHAIPYADLVGPGYNNHTYDFGFGPAAGTITIVKQTDGTDDTFDFTSADVDLDAVSLTTSGGTRSSTTFTKNAGTYTISEDSLAGWTLDNIEITGDTDGGSSVALPGGGTPAQCTDYFLDWGNISISPGGNYPHVQTITGVGGSNVDLTLTIERQGQDQNFNENFSQVQPYQDGDNSTLRTFRQANGDDFIVRLTMSEAVVINSMLFGGQRTFSSTNAGVAELTAWDGPDGTGNKVSANYANPSSSTTVAAPAAIPGTAAINILTGSGYGSQNAGYDNGTYIVVGTSSTRPWTVIDYNGASVRSFTWETYGSDSSDPAQARANENTIDHEFLSANLGRFYFQECEPAATEGTATIDLDAGENIVVTFTNSAETPVLALDKALTAPANGVAVEGDTVIFELTITNTGTVTVTELDLSDTFDAAYLQFSSASITPDTTGAGTLNWVGDSVAGTGSLLSQLPLGPGDSFVVTVEFVATKP